MDAFIQHQIYLNPEHIKVCALHPEWMAHFKHHIDYGNAIHAHHMIATLYQFLVCDVFREKHLPRVLKQSQEPSLLFIIGLILQRGVSFTMTLLEGSSKMRHYRLWRYLFTSTTDTHMIAFALFCVDQAFYNTQHEAQNIFLVSMLDFMTFVTNHHLDTATLGTFLITHKEKICASLPHTILVFEDFKRVVMEAEARDKTFDLQCWTMMPAPQVVHTVCARFKVKPHDTVRLLNQYQPEEAIEWMMTQTPHIPPVPPQVSPPILPSLSQPAFW